MMLSEVFGSSTKRFIKSGGFESVSSSLSRIRVENNDSSGSGFLEKYLASPRNWGLKILCLILLISLILIFAEFFNKKTPSNEDMDYISWYGEVAYVPNLSTAVKLKQSIDWSNF